MATIITDASVQPDRYAQVTPRRRKELTDVFYAQHYEDVPVTMNASRKRRKQLRAMKVFIQEVMTQPMADAAVERSDLEEARTWVATARLDIERIKKDSQDLKVALNGLKEDVMEVLHVHKDRLVGL